jgi:hypothetical protein
MIFSHRWLEHFKFGMFSTNLWGRHLGVCKH